MSDNTPTPEELASLEENQEEEAPQQQHSGSTPGQFVLALFVHQVARPLIVPRLEMRFASQVLKDPNLAKKMMDVRNPKQIEQVRQKLKFGDRLQKEKGDYRLTKDELLRRRYASIIAQQHHSRVDTLASNMKFQHAATRYGIDEGALRQRVATWKKQNPGRSVDEAMVMSSQQLHNEGLIQKGAKIDEKGLTKQYKKDAKEMYSEFSQAKEKALTQMETDPNEKARAQRSEEAINKMLDPNTPLPQTPQERVELIKQQIQEVETGQTAPPTQTPPAQQPVAAPLQPAVAVPSSQPAVSTPRPPVTNVPARPIASNQTAIHQPLQPPIPQYNAVSMPIRAPVAPSIPSVSIPSVSIPNISPSFSQNIFSDLFKSLQAKMAGLQQKISGAISRITSKLTGRLGKLAGRAFSATNALFNKVVDVGRKLLRNGINTIAPGLGTAIGTLSDIVRKITGIDIEGFIIKGVMKFLIIVTLCFIGIVILVVILAADVIPSYSGQDSTSMKITSTTPQMTWSQFEQRYFTYSPVYTENKNITWKQFESFFLYTPETYLSFGKR